MKSAGCLVGSTRPHPRPLSPLPATRLNPHLDAQRKAGNDARGPQWFQKHCGWDVTEDDDAEEIGQMMHSHNRADITQPMIVYPG